MLTLLVSAVAGPTLPTEILAEIVTLAAPKPEFDFLQTDWAQGVEYTTLTSLCLTSRVFNHLATPLVYSHLVIPTAEIAQSLIGTLDLDEWQTGERAGKAKEWVKCITIGSRVKRGEEVDGAFVEEVLSKFVGGGLSRLSIAGVTIMGTDTFSTLHHLKFLQLVQVGYDFLDGDPPVALDKVTHLHASDARRIGDHRFLQLVKLPNLTHFASRNTVPPRGYDSWLGLKYVASNLEFVAQQDPLGTAPHEAVRYGSSLAHLKHLVIPPSSSLDDEAGSGLLYLLGRLPNPLGVLDLAALSTELASSQSSGVSEAWRQNPARLNSSTVLRLPGPDERDLRGRRQLSDGAVRLGEVADLAEEGGLRVEWV